jgi:hypothetical protein
MLKSAINHDCEKYGCAAICLDPKLHFFDDCFDGGIRFGDIDAIIERKGHILIMEWKRYANTETFAKSHKAQFRLAEAFTLNTPKQTFVFVLGDPITMEVERYGIIRNGNWKWHWFEESKRPFKAFLRHWYLQADKNLTIECKKPVAEAGE